MIRGQQVSQALTMLKFTPHSAAKVVEKVLRSAVANAGPALRTTRSDGGRRNAALRIIIITQRTQHQERGTLWRQ